MDLQKLNLWRFNECADYLPNCKLAQYPIGLEQKVFSYICLDEGVGLLKPPGNLVTLPTFDIGNAFDNGRICDNKTVETFLFHLEFKVFEMIKEVLQIVDKDWELENIHIPIRDIKIFDNEDVADGCYGWVELGIAIIV